MECYQGSLRQFAEELLANGRGNGKMVTVAQLDDAIIEDMRKKGVVLQSLSFVVTQQVVFKYVHHPKTRNYPYEHNRLVKVVVHPNYKMNGRLIINLAKSWGIVDESKMNTPQYKLMK
jgi:hypothetical protein